MAAGDNFHITDLGLEETPHIPFIMYRCAGRPDHKCPRCHNAFACTCKVIHEWFYYSFWRRTTQTSMRHSDGNGSPPRPDRPVEEYPVSAVFSPRGSPCPARRDRPPSWRAARSGRPPPPATTQIHPATRAAISCQLWLPTPKHAGDVPTH